MKFIFALFVFLSFSTFAQRIGNNYALVVIDMQPYFVERGGNEKDPENIKKVNEILEQQTKMIEVAKKQNIPIIFIEYETFGETNSKLKDAVKDYENVRTFIKDQDGMLSNRNMSKKDLTEYLNSKEIGNLIITGANGGACVYQSISGSLAENYSVLAFKRGIADFNFADFLYPYSYSSAFSNVRCESCKFREIDDVEALTLELATNSPKISNEHISNIERGSRKEVPGSESKKSRGQATATQQ